MKITEDPEYKRVLNNVNSSMDGEGGRFPIPDYMKESARGYVMHGRSTGEFLNAVFANNLMRSIGRADLVNQRHILGYGQLLYTIPTEAYGSPEKVKAWQELGGMVGLLESHLEEVAISTAEASDPDPPGDEEP